MTFYHCANNAKYGSHMDKGLPNDCFIGLEIITSTYTKQKLIISNFKKKSLLYHYLINFDKQRIVFFL